MSKIYILFYSEWDGGGGDYTEDIVACRDRTRIEKLKTEMEEKSKVIREKIAVIKKRFDDDVSIWHQKMRPLYSIVSPLNGSKNQEERAKAKSELVGYNKKISDLYKIFNDAKDKILNEAQMEYYIEDPDCQVFDIAELELMEWKNILYVKQI